MIKYKCRTEYRGRDFKVLVDDIITVQYVTVNGQGEPLICANDTVKIPLKAFELCFMRWEDQD